MPVSLHISNQWYVTENYLHSAKNGEEKEQASTRFSTKDSVIGLVE